MSANGNNTTQWPCPNCRGPGDIVALWPYVGDGPVTQQHQNGDTAPNSLNTERQPREHLGPRYPVQVSGPEENQRWWEATDLTIPGRTSEGITYHSETRLQDGRPSLLIDPGSVGNLCGEEWAKRTAQAARQNNLTPKYTKRDRPLKVSGVGKGAQTCAYDCHIPLCFEKEDGTPQPAEIVTPSVPDSELPGLLGLKALRNNRAILDLNTLQIHFCGPGDYKLSDALPPGTDTFQCELAPSGHMVLPCCQYTRTPAAGSNSMSFTTNNTTSTMENLENKRHRKKWKPATPPPPSGKPPPFPVIDLDE